MDRSPIDMADSGSKLFAAAYRRPGGAATGHGEYSVGASKGSSGVSVDDRICSNCSGRVAATDVACRFCGVRFDAVIRPHGSLLNAFFRLSLGVWALSLPALCTYVGLTTPHGWGDFAANLTSRYYFIPWIVGIIALGIVTWLTEERG